MCLRQGVLTPLSQRPCRSLLRRVSTLRGRASSAYTVTSDPNVMTVTGRSGSAVPVPIMPHTIVRENTISKALRYFHGRNTVELKLPLCIKRKINIFIVYYEKTLWNRNYLPHTKKKQMVQV